MDTKKQVSSQRNDWSELRSSVPNASSPQPRLALATYATKPSVPPPAATTMGLHVLQSTVPKKPFLAWNRQKQQVGPPPLLPQPALPTLAPGLTSGNNSPTLADLALPEVRPQPMLAASSEHSGQSSLIIAKRSIAKYPSAVLRRLPDQVDAQGAPRQPPNTTRDEPQGKQWVFQMPVHGDAAAQGSSVTFVGTHVEEDHTKQRSARVMKVALGGGLLRHDVPPSARRVTNPLQSTTSAKVRQSPKGHAGPTKGRAPNTLDGADADLQVEGSALSELPHPASSLALLEASVAKERRAREELAAAHDQVLGAFKSVVRAYFGVLADPQRKATTAMSTAKCSVVVYTLITTIQSYFRMQLSARLATLRKQGWTHPTLALRAQASSVTAAPPMLSVQDLTMCCESAPASAESDDLLSDASSVHDRLLDNATIARLKQLYFDYYDCETFVLHSRGASAASAQVLPGAAADVIIEEVNVLHHPEEDDDVVEHIPEELPDCDGPNPVCSQWGGILPSRATSAASIALNASVARRDIFGSPTASDLCTPLSYTVYNAPYESSSCEVEDLA